jgi:hypothetical protein
MKKMLIVAGSAIAIFAGCQSTVMAQNARVSTPDVHADNACSHHHCNRKERVDSALRNRMEERAKAQAMLDEERRALAKECATGKGKRCAGTKEAEAVHHAPERTRSSQSSGAASSGALGFGGAATPNVRCPPGAYCLRP